MHLHRYWQGVDVFRLAIKRIALVSASLTALGTLPLLQEEGSVTDLLPVIALFALIVLVSTSVTYAIVRVFAYPPRAPVAAAAALVGSYPGLVVMWIGGCGLFLFTGEPAVLGVVAAAAAFAAIGACTGYLVGLGFAALFRRRGRRLV